MNKKILTAVLGIFILVAGIVIGTTLIKEDQDIREKAAPATVAYISPTNQNSEVGSNFSYYIKMDSGGNQISGVDLRLKFDPNTIQIVSLEKGANATNFDTTVSSTYDNTAGTIKYIIYSLDRTKAINGTGLDILKVNAKSKAGSTLGAYTLSFDSLTAASGITETQNIITTMTPGSVTLTAINNSSNSNSNNSSSAGDPNSCGGTCGSNYNCAMNYFCYQGFCRSPLCKEDSDCDCKVATTATPKVIAKATIKPTLKPTIAPKGGTETMSTDTPAPTLNSSYIDGNLDDEVVVDEPEVNKSFDIKLIGLIAGILTGMVLLYKGIKAMKKDQNNPPPTQTEPKTFDDTIQNPQ